MLLYVIPLQSITTITTPTLNCKMNITTSPPALLPLPFKSHIIVIVGRMHHNAGKPMKMLLLLDGTIAATIAATVLLCQCCYYSADTMLLLLLLLLLLVRCW